MNQENAPDGKTYNLRTLEDIFNLPSHDHMERCLAELPKIMLTARATADLMIGLAEFKGFDHDALKMGWPDVFEWIDDGQHQLSCEFNSPDGETLLAFDITPETRLPKHLQDCLVFAARYSHSRSTGAAGLVCNAIYREWSRLDSQTQDQILRESCEATENLSDWQALRERCVKSN